MASQRIVLTSPWKLGLFVFLLVVGTGFGLIYAYLELFNGTLELEDPETVRTLYAVLGGVAALGLLGYIACVTAARPMDKVVRGGKQRQQLLKKLGQIKDVRETDASDFRDVKEIAEIIRRWQEDAHAAQDAQLALLDLREEHERLLEEIESGDQEAESSPAAPPSTDALGAQGRATVEDALRTLWAKQRELGNFIESIGDCAADLSLRAQPGLAGPSAAPADQGPVQEMLRQDVARLTAVRSKLDELAEEANRLAITTALQVSRLGENSEEIVDTAEHIRALSTQFQRVAGDLRLCEANQDATLQKVQIPSAGADSEADQSGLSAIVMVLDQSTEALSEILGQLAEPLQQLESLVDPSASSKAAVKAPERREPTVTTVVPEPQVDPSIDETPSIDDGFSLDAEPSMDDGPSFDDGISTDHEPAGQSEESEIFEMAALGGHEIEDSTDSEIEGGEVYDLARLGAVEL